jgi:oligosaccharide reducing-end xylanase
MAPAWLLGCGDEGGDTPGGETPGGAGSGGNVLPPAGPPPMATTEPLALSSTGTVNLFVELAGKTQAEVDEKVTTAVNRFFGIGTGEPNELIEMTGYRCYYELPQDPSMAFIWAADSDDIRSEGMSYGMMIAVQMGLREQFDRLWKFSKTYLQYPADSSIGAWRHYFKWQGRVDRSNPQQWAVNYGADTVPAPDGDEYFAAALLLAHDRWGSDGEVNYQAEGRAITSAMLNNPTEGNRYPIIHETQNMVTFVPFGNSNNISDPSYHLPAFYDLYARDGALEDAEAWRSVAEVSRAYLVTSANAATGLHPDYASFTGVPNAGGERHDEFRFDAWRVVMNMAMDYAWFEQDDRMRAQVERYHAFFSTRLTETNVMAALFEVDGSNPEGGGSTALTATLAAGSLASGHPDRARFVNALWGVGQQQGRFRYYQESVYLLGLLHAAGKFSHTFE